MTIEVLIPVRNPTEVFDQTVESLALQTDKNFSVLISDNFSTKGQEHLAAALAKLAAAGIAARQIQPPMELERVEHWNWAHYQSSADWLKPLFVGDWLDPVYVSRVREIAAAEPACRYVFSNGWCHRAGHAPASGHNPWAGRFNPPAVMQDVVLRYGMNFGSPSAAAYDRAAFFALGGYPTGLPISADLLFYCTLAARFGAAGIQEKLVHFNTPAVAPSQEQGATFRETMISLLMLGYHAWTERDRFPVAGFLRLLARETKNCLIRN